MPLNTGRKMLGEIVCVIVLAFIPVNSNLFEELFTVKPMHFHVPCFGLFWFHARIYKAISGGVVCFESVGRLFVTKTNEKGKNSDTFFSIAECTRGFSSASEETTLRIVLHVVRIGPLRLVDGR